MSEATRRIEALGKPQAATADGLQGSRRHLGDTFGPIVIVIDEGIPCIWIYVGDTVCVICAFDVIKGAASDARAPPVGDAQDDPARSRRPLGAGPRAAECHKKIVEIYTRYEKG